jgi:D-inositol-3-phosphate glycosyltransferase
MRRLLWIGDAGVATGFAKATHATLDVLRETWDVHVLGINYLGDPHEYPYPIYPCYPGGDAFGVNRTKKLVTKLKPDLVILQNDPWNIPAYMKKLDGVPVIGSMPVDGLNCRGEGLNGLRLAIFWTEFGMHEAGKGGHTGPSTVIPLGVDLSIYSPGDRLIARRALGMEGAIDKVFIIGNINRNQPRKRLDLTLRYFAEWVQQQHVKDAYLYLHLCPTGDDGYDIPQLAHYYGVDKRVIFVQPEIGPGDAEERLVSTYRSFDVQVSTTQGEGWGLTTMEGMACGIPQIAPDWAALGEWANGVANLVPCTTTNVTPNNVNVVGGVADPAGWIDALHRVYCNWNEERERMTRAGLELVARPEYRWRAIGESFRDAVDEVLYPQTEAAVG